MDNDPRVNRLNASVRKAEGIMIKQGERVRELEGQLAEARTASLHVVEPPVYGPGSGHSWFRDVAAVGARETHITRDGGPEAAQKRLDDHAVYEHRRIGRTLAAARRRAEYLTEDAITSTPAEAVLYERWRRDGGELFERKHELAQLERRALDRTPGTGGYFAPPAWLTSEFVHSPRAGAPLAALWRRLEMPPGVQSINLPRFATGGASGAMADGGSVPSRDPSDSSVKASLVTIAAQVDMSAQWLDQSPAPVDSTIGADLAEDFAIQLDGQLVLGSGAAPQAAGVIPAGGFSAGNSIWLQSTTNVTGMSWANGGGATPAIAGSLHEATAQLRAKISRYRGLGPTAYVMAPQMWDLISGSGVDSQDRPLIPPGMGSADQVPMLHRTRVVEDSNIPLTFGGATAPSIGVSAGITSPAPGDGTWTPILAGRWEDCIYWQSEPVVRVMAQVLAGTLQVRFQVYCYIATAPNRVVWGGANAAFAGSNQGGGVNTGAGVSYGALTQFTANSVSQLAAAGY